ncbi:MAG: hypothetical protein ACLP3K_06415 [Candidatus Acidiferrales bacterium]
MNANAIPTFRAWVPPRSRGWIPEFAAQVGLFSIICLSILFPAIPVSSGLSLKIEQPLAIVIIGVYGWLLLAGIVRPIRLNAMFLIAALFAFSISLSMWYGSQVLGHNLIFRDYFEPPKMFLIALYFTIGYEAELSEASLQRLLNFLSVAVVLIAVYGWGQFFDLGFAYKLNPYFSGGLHHELGLELHHRVYSTMGNPNVLGEVLSWFLVLYTMAFLFKVGSPFRNAGTAFLCLLTSVMTASRYCLLASLFGFAMVILTSAGALRRRATQLFLLLFVLLPLFTWTFLTVELKNQSTFERFNALKHPMEVDSLQERFNKVWLEAAFYFEKSPFLGNGPAKGLFLDSYDDSEYLAILKRYGVLGFMPYLAFLLLPLFLCGRGLKAIHGRAGPILEERLPLSSLMARFGFSMVVMAIFMNIGMSTFTSDTLQGFTFLWFGLACRCAKTVSDASANLSPALAYTKPRALLTRGRLSPTVASNPQGDG